MARGYYLNYIFEYSKLFEILNNNNYKKINFFIDLQSIATGFYNKDTVLVEVGQYAENNKISNILLKEYHKFLENLYNKFRIYDPYFITFYDDGFCSQNKSLLKDYKSGNSIKNLLLDDSNTQLFREIKKYYFVKILKHFNNDLCKTYYLNEYEADFVPYYCIMNDLFDSQDSKICNVILSKDKDLLQCCRFKNTFQVVTSFKTGIQKRFSEIYTDTNCLSYIYKKFKVGLLTAKHVSWVLAFAGDQADGVPGLPGIGPAKAVSLVESMYNILPDNVLELENLNRLGKLPQIISNNIDTVKLSYKLISFEEQIKRIPKPILELF